MMKLSEAMRLGATLKPQAFGRITRFLLHLDNAPLGTCALGSCLDAIGKLPLIGMVLPGELYPREWVDFLETTAACPVKGCQDDHECVSIVIVHLNDEHEWTREQIADWVETVEAQVAAPVEEMAVAQV